MTSVHLAEVIGMLGPPPLDLIRRGVRSPEFFTPDGKYIFYSGFSIIDKLLLSEFRSLTTKSMAA